jgi:hypothetical protein
VEPPVLFLDCNAGFTMLYLSLAVALESDTLVDASYRILQQVTGAKGKKTTEGTTLSRSMA